MDWPTFGPRDPEIADLVDALAASGMRLPQIEALITAALQQRLGEIEGK